MENRSAPEGKTEGWGGAKRQKISIFVCVPAVSSPLVFLLPLPKFLVAGLSFPMVEAVVGGGGSGKETDFRFVSLIWMEEGGGCRDTWGRTRKKRRREEEKLN